jgi:hypothetical protein
MSFNFEERLAASPLVESIWRSRSEGLVGSAFISQAVSHWEIVITKQQGNISLTLRGPETLATTAPVPAEAEFVGIQFKLGSFMPHLPNFRLVDNSLNLPQASSKAFWLAGSAWPFPDYENADTFVDRLVRAGLVVQDAQVAAAVQGHLPKELSLRSLQRRFLRATGLTQTTLYQIERARQAAALLEQGCSILDTVEQTCYSDQPHLTRALRRFIGQTPAQLLRMPHNHSR